MSPKALAELGIEALKLLEEFTQGDGIVSWNVKREQLLQTWRINREQAMLQAKTTGKGEEVELRIVGKPFMSYMVSSKEDVLDVPEVQSAMQDSSGVEFSCLMLRGTLLQAKLTTSDPMNPLFFPIAEVSEIPPWMDFPKVT